jgi:ketosteroid isomerase-like protein
MSDTREDEAIAMVERFMLASMEGDRGVTDELMSPDIEVTFVGGQKLRKPEEIRAVNSRRYRNVAKSIERAGWPRVIAHPRLPQIRTCPIRASGSSA